MNTSFKPVNWIQGMCVSSTHFVETENYMTERLMKCVELLQGNFSYGLLPTTEEEESLQITIVGKGENAKVVLYSYHGITQGGYYIDVDTNNESISFPCSEIDSINNDGWDIVLSVAPFERIPCGEPNIQENPPRYPYVSPLYKLIVVARENNQINTYGPYDVVVGHLKKKETEYKLDEEFIPPSLFMNSHHLLLEHLSLFSRQLSSIKESLDIIVEKALAPNVNRSEVLLNVVEIAKCLEQGIASCFFNWHNKGYSLTPFQVVEIISTLSNRILTSLLFMSKQGKEDVLKYFYEWNGINPSEFERILDEVVRIKYNQNRIGNAMKIIEDALNMLEELLISLSRLDYVGQHKESIVVSVSSSKDSIEQNKKSSWLL